MSEDKNKLQNKNDAAITPQGAVELAETELAQAAGGAATYASKVNKSSPDLM